MIPKALAKKIRYIEIYTAKAANDILAGAYESVFKGRGMEFDEVREYSPGDEVRSIDWNVTARMGHPYIKRYVEERELTIMFLADVSASGTFGSADQTKNEAAAELCALLAFSAIKNNDKVGLIAFTDAIEMHIRPGKGASHVLRLIRDILHFTPRQRGTNLTRALEYLARTAHKRCVVFVISDFQTAGYERALRILARRHDVIALVMTDPRELEMPKAGLIELEDAETGELVLLDTGSAREREAFARQAQERHAALRRFFRRESIDHIEVAAGQDYVGDLLRFFQRRRRRAAA